MRDSREVVNSSLSSALDKAPTDGSQDFYLSLMFALPVSRITYQRRLVQAALGDTNSPCVQGGR